MVFQSKRLIPAVGIATVILTASACGVVKNMNEMHDATQSVDSKTGELVTKTGALLDKTGNLSDQIALTNAEVQKTNLYLRDTYDDLRQAQGATVRNDYLVKMEKASSPEAKISAAAVYFMAQEFQLWKNMGADNADRKLALYAESMQDFFRVIKDYEDRDRPINPASTDPRMQNLEALAITMHFVNPNSLVDAKTHKAVSVLSLIEDTLARRGEFETMDAHQRSLLPQYQQEILSNEQDAVYLLQLRANFLGAMVLANISDIQEQGIAGAIVKLRMFTSAWDANLTGKNVFQLDAYKMWMDEGNRTVTELKDMGYDPRLDSKLLRIYRNMRFDATQAKGVSDRSSERLQLSAQDLGVSIDRFRAK